MKKKAWLFVLPLALLAAVLIMAMPTEDKAVELGGTAEGLRLELTDAAGTVEIIQPWTDAEGNAHIFLPAYATDSSAKLVSADGTENALPAELGSVVFADGKQVELLRGSSLPAVYLTTESGSLAAIAADKSHKESGTIRIVNADGTLHYEGLLAQIKGRGNTTWEYEKKPYNIKLKEKADLFGMGEAKSWCLLANYRDLSYVRNAMVFDYALAMGVENTTDTQSFDLYVNGEYQGLYQMTEKVEIGKNRLDVPDIEEENELGNPQMKLDEFPAFDRGTKRGVSLPYTPAERNGFLMELDFADRWAEEASGFVTEAGQHVVLKYPEYASEEQVDYVSELVQSFESKLLAGDPAYLDYIDLDSWVQLYLIEEIFEDVDCGLSSIYFYVMDGKLVAGPLWDFDLTMGASYAVENPETLYAAWRERTERFTSYYLPALYADETFRNRVEELYESAWSAELHALAGKAEGYVENIIASAKMDALRWNRDHEATAATASYLSSYIARRADFLDRLWIEDEPYHRVRLMGNVYTRYYEYMVRDGETFDAFPALGKENHTLEGWFYEGTDKPFDPEKPITEATYLYAKWKQN